MAGYRNEKNRCVSRGQLIAKFIISHCRYQSDQEFQYRSQPISATCDFAYTTAQKITLQINDGMLLLLFEAYPILSCFSLR